MNHVVKGLFFKEWKMMKGFFIGQFAIAAVLFFILPFHEAAFRSDQLVEMLVLAIIVIPGAVLFSLNMEVNQMQSFLHNPHSMKKLLAVKILYSLFAAVSLLSVLTIIITIYALFDTGMLSVLRLWRLIMLTSGNLLLVSFYPAVLLLFLWTLHQILRTRIGGGISIVLVVALLIAGSKLMDFFADSSFYEGITHWGRITSTSGFLIGPGYIGVYLFFAIVTIFLFFVSAQLMERKAEV